MCSCRHILLRKAAILLGANHELCCCGQLVGLQKKVVDVSFTVRDADHTGLGRFGCHFRGQTIAFLLAITFFSFDRATPTLIPFAKGLGGTIEELDIQNF